MFLVALSLRAGWGTYRLAQADDPSALEFPDEQQYWDMAASLMAGEGLKDELGFRATRMPLYPTLLAAWARPSDEVTMPSRGGREITLLDLSTHHSALPRLPDNMSPANPANPYADYTVEQMYAFLSGHELRRDIGSEFEYSNLAVGLLGHVLARAHWSGQQSHPLT